MISKVWDSWFVWIGNKKSELARTKNENSTADINNFIKTCRLKMKISKSFVLSISNFNRKGWITNSLE